MDVHLRDLNVTLLITVIAVDLEFVFNYSAEIDYGILREDSPNTHYNWYFHWQFLKKPRNDSAWNLVPFLLPGQTFLHIWVEVHSELCKKESGAH